MSLATVGTIVASLCAAGTLGVYALATPALSAPLPAPAAVHTSGPVIDDPDSPAQKPPTAPPADDPNVVPIPPQDSDEPDADDTPPDASTDTPAAPGHGQPPTPDTTVPDPLPNPQWPTV